ncbi:MAG: hypothetical protein IKQ57_04585 [Candidatus Methanomethylophilaceae archaeon]|nr:hypothetical protein [Candidatus Methanomethylophilaceae archaeon]
MVEYTGLSEFICGNPNWVYPNPMLNEYCPFDSYNLAYDLAYKVWEILGGTIAWLVNLIWPGNPISTWLVDDPPWSCSPCSSSCFSSSWWPSSTS